MRCDSEPILLGELRWLSPLDGRTCAPPPPGTVYSPTAHLPDEDVSSLFGIAFHILPSFSSGKSPSSRAEARLLAPDTLDAERLRKLADAPYLVVTEGSRPVAHFHISSVLQTEALNSSEPDSERRLHELEQRHAALVHAAEAVQEKIERVKRAG